MYANGFLPSGALTKVQSGIYLSNATARQYKAMAAAFKKDTGFTMTIAKPAGGYRSYATQLDMHRNPRKYGLNPHSSVPIAAAGSSSHGYGTRVDIGIGAPWAVAHGERFGFRQEFGDSDFNHLAYNGTTVTASLHTSPVKIPKDGNNMAPRVFNHKIKVSSTVKGKTVVKTVKEWVRFWETSIETTQNGDYCNLWKSEAGQISSTKTLSTAAYNYLAGLVAERRKSNNITEQP